MRKWIIILLALMMLPGFIGRVEASPVVMLAGVQSRISKSAITMTEIDTGFQEMGQVVSETLYAELAANPKFTMVDNTETARIARMDETALINQLGNGQINLELQKQADYITERNIDDGIWKACKEFKWI